MSGFRVLLILPTGAHTVILLRLIPALTGNPPLVGRLPTLGEVAEHIRRFALLNARSR